MREPRTIVVLYDAGCELCRGIRAWIRSQPVLVVVRFVPAGSLEAKALFPHLDHASTLGELTVVDDGGGVYRGAKAWLVCLWALRDYRRWSARLAAPERRMQLERFVHWVATHRGGLGAAARLLPLA